MSFHAHQSTSKGILIDDIIILASHNWHFHDSDHSQFSAQNRAYSAKSVSKHQATARGDTSTNKCILARVNLRNRQSSKQSFAINYIHLSSSACITKPQHPEVCKRRYIVINDCLVFIVYKNTFQNGISCQQGHGGLLTRVPVALGRIVHAVLSTCPFEGCQNYKASPEFEVLVLKTGKELYAELTLQMNATVQT